MVCTALMKTACNKLATVQDQQDSDYMSATFAIAMLLYNNMMNAPTSLMT